MSRLLLTHLRYLAIFGDIWRYLAIFGDIWRYLAIFGDISAILAIIALTTAVTRLNIGKSSNPISGL